MSNIAYIVSCEVVCGEGSDGALEGMEHALLVLGVNATSEDDAIAKIEASFEDEGYALVEIDWISEAAKMVWEDAEGEAEGKDIIAQLTATPDEVVYSSIYALTDEDISAAA